MGRFRLLTSDRDRRDDMSESTVKHLGIFWLTHWLRAGRRAAAAITVHSLELDNDLPRLPCQIANVPVAIKVGNQPVRDQRKRSTIKSTMTSSDTRVRVQTEKWHTWLSALRHLWAGKIWRRSSWPIPHAPRSSSCPPPRCSSLALYPGGMGSIYKVTTLWNYKAAVNWLFH